MHVCIHAHAHLRIVICQLFYFNHQNYLQSDSEVTIFYLVEPYYQDQFSGNESVIKYIIGVPNGGNFLSYGLNL